MFFGCWPTFPKPEPKIEANDDGASVYVSGGGILVFTRLHLFICPAFSIDPGFILTLFRAPRIAF